MTTNTTEYGFRVPASQRGRGGDLDVWPNKDGNETMTLDEIKRACKRKGYVLIAYDRTPVRVVSIRD